MKKLRFICLVICLALSLASCRGIVKMNYNENGELCTKNGLTYKYAPMGYEPVSVGEEWALIDEKLQEKLYCIGDADPEKWLTTEYLGSATMVYYASDIKLPDLKELDAQVVYFCEKGDSVISLYTIGEQSGEDKIIDSLTELMLDENAEQGIWPRADVNESFELRFYSSEYPTIYYTVTYAACAGGNFVYDMVTGRCINVGDLLTQYHENTYDADVEV